MSVAPTSTQAAAAKVECILSESQNYRETLTLQPVAAQPGLIELVIHTQLMTARNPEEKRVKARCCIERSRLVALGAAISHFPQAAGSSGERVSL
jgi:hypothetical protein